MLFKFRGYISLILALTLLCTSFSKFSYAEEEASGYSILYERYWESPEVRKELLIGLAVVISSLAALIISPIGIKTIKTMKDINKEDPEIKNIINLFIKAQEQIRNEDYEKFKELLLLKAESEDIPSFTRMIILNDNKANKHGFIEKIINSKLYKNIFVKENFPSLRKIGRHFLNKFRDLEIFLELSEDNFQGEKIDKEIKSNEIKSLRQAISFFFSKESYIKSITIWNSYHIFMNNVNYKCEQIFLKLLGKNKDV